MHTIWNQDTNYTYNVFTPIIHHKDFAFKEKNKFIRYIKKYALPLSCLPVCLWCYDDIKTAALQHPYLSTILFYVTINFITDLLLEYEEEDSLLTLIIILKNIAKDLIVLQAAEKYFSRRTQKTNVLKHIALKIKKNEFLCNEQELARISFKLYQEIKAIIHQKNPSLIIESEEFIFLSQPSTITMDTALYITQNNYTLHQIVFNFYMNPTDHFVNLVDFLQEEIRSLFLSIEASLFIENSEDL